jgi:hypothetical protein
MHKVANDSTSGQNALNKKIANDSTSCGVLQTKEHLVKHLGSSSDDP